MTCGIAVIARSQDTTWPRAGGAFSGVPSMIDSLEVEVLYPASGSCVSRPCPPESGPSASDLRGPDDRIVSSERDVRVFHEGNFPSSRFLLIYLDVSCLDPFTNVLPRITLDPPLLVTRVVSRASGTITFSDSCLCITSHFASAYRVAFPVAGRNTGRSPGVTHESSVSCRQQTPWCDG